MRIFNELVPSKECTAVALGYFDGIHMGHKAVIEKTVNTKKDGLSPVVLTFSKSPKGVISGDLFEALETFEHKAKHLEKAGVEKLYVADFLKIKDMSPRDFVEKILIEKLNVKQVFCGFNYHFGKGGKGTGETLVSICKEFGVAANVVPPVIIDGEIVSSTRIRNLLKEGNIKQANKLLGYDFGITTDIIHGNHIGKGLGFPTINQPAKEGVIVPKFGVYASVVTIENKKYCGVTNVGVKPTIGKYSPLYETWMPKYSGEDLYGKVATVELKEFIRPERKFENLEELKQTVLKNGEQVLEIIGEV